MRLWRWWKQSMIKRRIVATYPIALGVFIGTLPLFLVMWRIMFKLIYGY